MDSNNTNKALPRSHSGVDAQSVNRKQRKPSKKSQNVVCDRDGRGQGPHQHHDNPFPLFNNRSLSMLSTMHHLNPHRKVAMSPEILREAEEQACSLRKAVKQLQEQLEKSNREKARIHRFLSDLLYTLNARGYESVRDHEGTLVDLNKCKGDAYLDLKGRDLKQRVSVRRPGGQEIYLKAVIGNQERAIQSLVYRLDSFGRDMVLGNRLNIDDSSSISNQESSKIASLESEVLQLVNLIEGACQKCPNIYSALRDQYYLSEGIECIDLSPRNPVIQNILKKCEQIAGEAQSRQLVDMLTSPNGQGQRPRSQQSSKSAKTRSVSKPKSASNVQRTPRPTSSENPSHITTVRPTIDNMKNVDHIRGGENRPSTYTTRGTETDVHLRRINGQSKSESNFQHNKEISTNFPRSSSSTSGGEPLATYLTKSRADHAYDDNNLTVCPYCSRRFGIEESISEIKNHIEMHIFAGDTTLP
ncbi:hypothetical protein Ocin01_01790 [Orchesella cincta]|uniref:Uncharacterized protein n=1 Tax=Orchesella cincta TaxID=48709 RepID=A0A1D2NHZ9_ORCCI|nr:hypothetical protein Ocin01_01790 [Orchesella cincta]